MEQISGEKVLEIRGEVGNFTLITNKNSYKTKLVAVGIGASNPFCIEGLEEFVISHKKAAPEKNRLQLQNEDHLVKEGVYAMGTLAGHQKSTYLLQLEVVQVLQLIFLVCGMMENQFRFMML